MTQSKGYVDSDYLRLVGESVRHLKQRTYERLDLKHGMSVLDVGCGSASDTIPMARLVAPDGLVVGVDHDAAMLLEADARAREAGVLEGAVHVCSESAKLPFASGSFDAVRSERLFQHLTDPASTLAEMMRVAKSGGLVLVLDTDWGSASTDTTETDVERRLAQVHAERAAYNGYSGRRLYGMFKHAGFGDVEVEVYVNWSTDYGFVRRATLLDDVERIAVSEGVVTEDEVGRLREQLERADSEGAFFSSTNQMLVTGRKP